jgi:uncharacterized protein (DUF2147 family)
MMSSSTPLMARTAAWLLAGLCMASSCAWAQMTPTGLWRNIDDKTGQAKAEVRIIADGAGTLTGVVEKALVTNAQPTCTECTDDRKDKPKLGMEIIRGARKAEGRDVWEGGKILDPENGKNYTLRLTPIDSGSKLEVRGSIGPFGRTQTWIRIQ